MCLYNNVALYRSVYVRAEWPVFRVGRESEFLRTSARWKDTPQLGAFFSSCIRKSGIIRVSFRNPSHSSGEDASPQFHQKRFPVSRNALPSIVGKPWTLLCILCLLYCILCVPLENTASLGGIPGVAWRLMMRPSCFASVGARGKRKTIRRYSLQFYPVFDTSLNQSWKPVKMALKLGRAVV